MMRCTRVRTQVQVSLYKIISISEFREEDFDSVIVACGFQMHTVPLFDKNGCECDPVPEYSKGGTKVDAKGACLRITQFIPWGWCAGLAPVKEIGGEPGSGCTRRSDGIVLVIVWLYQYTTIGTIIRNSLKQGRRLKT